MQHAGPKRTIPPPAERPPASRRWSLQLLVGLILMGAAFLILRLLNEDRVQPDEESASIGAIAPPSADESDARGREQPTTDPGSASHSTAAIGDEFANQLQRVFARHFLEGTPYSAEIADQVAAARLGDAAALLESKAAGGDRDANVVLANLNALCEWPASQEALAAIRGQLEVEQARSGPVPGEVRRRIETSLAVEQERIASLDRACTETHFDSARIEQRLRSAAQAGHEASLWALGGRTDDAELRNKYWLSAAMLGYLPAQVSLAQSLLAENLRGDRRNRGRMNFWLETAAKQSPRAMVSLGECRLNGCNAQPPDSESAVPLLREAAALGEYGAFTALASISRGDPAALTDQELYSLLSFQQQLNELGCYGATPYGSVALESLRASREIASRLSPHGVDEAREIAAATWREHGSKARRAQGCD